VKKATCPSNRESEMVNLCNITYDIVRRHTTSYVSIRHRTLAYDIVRQHTMMYVNIRCCTSAYDVVRRHTTSHTICNMLERTWVCVGGGSLTKKSVQAFLAWLLEVSKARSLPFWTSFRVSKRTYSSGQISYTITYGALAAWAAAGSPSGGLVH
jgi:hypothetical protein